MRWPKTSADLLSDQTFLIIRQDLQTIKEKCQLHLVKSEGAGGDDGGGESTDFLRKQVASRSPRCGGRSGTWPPKMRKKRLRKPRIAMYESTGEEKRPSTASLEMPLVLDPRLIDKLDMSLISKESLNVSLSRLNLSLELKPVESVGKKSGNQPSSLLRPRARFAKSNDKGGRLSQDSLTTSSESDTKRSPTPSPDVVSNPEGKKLDDNNNKNKQHQQQQPDQQHQHLLSPVRRRISRSPVSSSDVAIFTCSASGPPKKKAAEPCRACGRAVQPERFHSHPENQLSPKTTVNGTKSSPSVIPVRATGAIAQAKQQPPGVVADKKTPTQSPRPMSRPTTPKSGEQSNLATMSGSKSPSNEAIKKERKINSATVVKVIENKSEATVTKRRPRSVTCYICGREFGTASFPIHEPKCLQKWQRENKALPSTQRRQIPQRPNVPCDHEDWNSAAWEQSQALLVPCLKCKRTFLPDRLVIHERNCRVQLKGTSNNSSTGSDNIMRLSIKDPKETLEASEAASVSPTLITKSESPRMKPLLQYRFKDSRSPGRPARKSSRIAVRNKSALDKRIVSKVADN